MVNTTEAAHLARRLMNQHGLGNWHFQYDRAVYRFGQCSYPQKRISLSAPLTRNATEDQVRNTILHEIAHALVGSKAAHGPVWRMKALEIGCNGQRCADLAPEQHVAPKYHGVCTSHGVVSKHHRMPRKLRSCGKCSPRFDDRYVIRIVAAR